MKRRTLDAIASWVGVLMVGSLVVASGMLFWGYTFVNGQVHNQLAEQQIFFPARGSAALAPSTIGPYLNKYAGQELVNGAQAEAYADHFIAVHLSEVAGGKTYSQASAAAMADPTNTKLAGQVQTLFQGTTLRGLLLTSYAFWKIGQLALIGSIAALALAVVMGALTLLGFRHLRKVDPDQPVALPFRHEVAATS